ncbi:peptidoglycan/LPS O-acetylase OafA/YrhL [Chitinophaga niastensis]|uniref:Peptidoglycan/LPS O-acetylase OafA/YrhL n=1 Tax=Chitinophaga niastensis TaxID=536980 RepID=A0A2P8HM79_CHINA|nr:acyltransferase [Chitinophaga niastensis]PSL47325.1 peptidoglycan/LPS O-acetylase OafA/YrhL [Chitinophaga niastensis]
MRTKTQHFYSLDAIRGFSAIIIVLYHWRHFFLIGDKTLPGAFDKTQLPLYTWFAILYDDGALAVDMFFLLSGFIFFWLYADRIINRKTSLRVFFCYRFTRLYPLVIVTLLIVAFLQWDMINLTGHYFVYQYNDPYHFILNLFCINSWGLEKGPSFNGPVWTVSVEVLLYIVFFLICRMRLHKKWILFALVAIGALIQHFYTPIGQGLYSFFLGALTYYLYKWILKQHNGQKLLNIITVITILLWVMILTEYKYSYLLLTWKKLVHQHLPHSSPTFADSSFSLCRNVFFRTIVSPISILSIVLWETSTGFLKEKWAFLGNYSYACYLLHFPLQLLAVIVAHTFGLRLEMLRTPYALLLFFIILLPLSLATYYYFELPLQQMLRKKILKKREPVIIPGANAIT